MSTHPSFVRTKRSRPHIAVQALAALLPLAIVAGCSDSSSSSGEPKIGSSEFSGRPANSGGRAQREGAKGANLGAPAPSASGPTSGAAADNTAAGQPRLIEEGDIVKLQGATLYVLNQYRGLQVVDLGNPDKPVLLSRAPLYGHPIEMYVRGGVAFALYSDYWTYWRCPECLGQAQSFHGSTVAAIDVSNPAAATVRTTMNVEGVITDSRVVGDVLYVVSNRYASWYADGKTDDTRDVTFVQSIDIANPEKPRLVDRVDFPRDGWQNQIHATDKLLFVGSSNYGNWDNNRCQARMRPQATPNGTGVSGGSTVASKPAAVGQPQAITPCSHITAVDISSADGKIVVGASADVPGTLQDRWVMDHYQGVFRVITFPGFGNTQEGPTVRTFQARTAGELRPLGMTTVKLPRAEMQTATRFDGPRAYIVTFERTDPLWTIDLTNPERPFVAGQLQTPGWLDYIEPRGERFVAFGRDRASDREPWRLHVSLYDVSNLARPRLITRHLFGEGWAEIPAQRDDFQKLFKVLDAQKLVLMPFRSWVNDEDTPWFGRYVGGVQVFDLDLEKDVLAKRGFVEHSGLIERALPYGGDILTLSNELLQVVDLADRDKPKLRGAVELARDVNDIALAGDKAIELVGDTMGRGNTQLYVVPAADPNVTTPLAKFDLPAFYGRLYANGNFAYVVSEHRQLLRGPATGGAQPAFIGETTSTRVDVVEIAPTPRKRGALVLPHHASYWYEGGLGGEANGVTQVGGSTLVLGFSRTPCGDGKEALGAPAGSAPSSAPPTRSPQRLCEGPDADFYVIDLANPDAPKVASKILLDNSGWVNAAGVSGTNLYVSHYEELPQVKLPNGELDFPVRYFVTRIDLKDPARPGRGPKVNVPGVFLAARDSTLFTVDTRSDDNTGKPTALIYALDLPAGSSKAYLQAKLAIDGSDGQVLVDKGGAFTVANADLVALDLRDPRNLKIASRTRIPGLQPIEWTAGEPGSSGGSGTVAVGAAGVGVATPDIAIGGGSGFGISSDSYGGFYASNEAWLRQIVGGKLFVSVDAGFLIYDVGNLAQPALDRYVRTQGPVQEIRPAADGSRAFLPAGFYGVDVVGLGK